MAGDCHGAPCTSRAVESHDLESLQQDLAARDRQQAPKGACADVAPFSEMALQHTGLLPVRSQDWGLAALFGGTSRLELPNTGTSSAGEAEAASALRVPRVAQSMGSTELTELAFSLQGASGLPLEAVEVPGPGATLAQARGSGLGAGGAQQGGQPMDEWLPSSRGLANLGLGSATCQALGQAAPDAGFGVLQDVQDVAGEGFSLGALGSGEWGVPLSTFNVASRGGLEEIFEQGLRPPETQLMSGEHGLQQQTWSAAAVATSAATSGNAAGPAPAGLSQEPQVDQKDLHPQEKAQGTAMKRPSTSRYHLQDPGLNSGSPGATWQDLGCAAGEMGSTEHHRALAVSTPKVLGSGSSLKPSQEQQLLQDNSGAGTSGLSRGSGAGLPTPSHDDGDMAVLSQGSAKGQSQSAGLLGSAGAAFTSPTERLAEYASISERLAGIVMKTCLSQERSESTAGSLAASRAGWSEGTTAGFSGRASASKASTQSAPARMTRTTLQEMLSSPAPGAERDRDFVHVPLTVKGKGVWSKVPRDGGLPTPGGGAGRGNGSNATLEADQQGRAALLLSPLQGPRQQVETLRPGQREQELPEHVAGMEWGRGCASSASQATSGAALQLKGVAAALIPLGESPSGGTLGLPTGTSATAADARTGTGPGNESRLLAQDIADSLGLQGSGSLKVPWLAENLGLGLRPKGLQGSILRAADSNPSLRGVEEREKSGTRLGDKRKAPVEGSEDEQEEERRERQRALNREAGRRMRERRAHRLSELEQSVARLQSEERETAHRLEEKLRDLEALKKKGTLLQQKSAAICELCLTHRPDSAVLKDKVELLLNLLNPDLFKV